MTSWQVLERAAAARGDLPEAESHFNLPLWYRVTASVAAAGRRVRRTAGRVLQRRVLGPQGTSQSTDDMIDADCTPFKKW